jgi:hypothetical protein
VNDAKTAQPCTILERAGNGEKSKCIEFHLRNSPTPSDFIQNKLAIFTRKEKIKKPDNQIDYQAKTWRSGRDSNPRPRA